MSSGIWVMATTNVMKKRSTMNGSALEQEREHDPGVATGTIVISAYPEPPPPAADQLPASLIPVHRIEGRGVKSRYDHAGRSCNRSFRPCFFAGDRLVFNFKSLRVSAI